MYVKVVAYQYTCSVYSSDQHLLHVYLFTIWYDICHEYVFPLMVSLPQCTIILQMWMFWMGYVCFLTTTHLTKVHTMYVDMRIAMYHSLKRIVCMTNYIKTEIRFSFCFNLKSMKYGKISWHLRLVFYHRTFLSDVSIVYVIVPQDVEAISSIYALYCYMRQSYQALYIFLSVK